MSVETLRARHAICCIAMLVFGVAMAGAQEADPADSARVQFGPLALNPTMTVRDIGIDSNVFNDRGGQERDFTATLSPKLEAIVRVGVARLTIVNTQDFVYFQKFKSQQSVNGAMSGRFEVALGPLRPFVEGQLRRTRDRPGFEIDARARRTEEQVGGGLTYRLTPTTRVVAAARRSDIRFLDGEEFLGVALDTSLNRRSETGSLEVHLDITPVTTLVLTAEGRRDRFEEDALRDADSLRVTSGLQFSPGGVFSGRADLGFRQFEPKSTALPAYAGAVASASVTYTASETTSFDIRFDRDIDYSFEALHPYYVTSGGNLGVSQRIAGPISVLASAGRHRQTYRAVDSVTEPSRADTVETYGGGIGCRLAARALLTVNGEYTTRRSTTTANREFDRTRIYATVTYGF